MIIESTDSYEASESEDGLHITEKKKGILKMLGIFCGFGLLGVIASFILVFTRIKIAVILAPFVFWGGALIFVVTLISFIVKTLVNSDPHIHFNANTKELNIRGKVIPFSDIESVDTQFQEMLGKIGSFIFLRVNGKKKSVFSTSVVVKDKSGIEDLAERIKSIVNTADTTDLT